MHESAWLRAASLTGLLCLAIAQAACSTPFSRSETTPLTPEARAQRAERLFELMDRNRDGRLSRHEMGEGLRGKALAGSSYSRSELMLGLDGGAGKAEKSARSTPKPMTEEEIRRTIDVAMAVQDADLDQHLSRDEFRKMVLEKHDTSAPWQNLL